MLSRRLGGRWWLIVLALSLGWVAAAVTPASAEGRPSTSSVDEWVDAYLRTEGLSGAAVAVVRDGQIVVETCRSTEATTITASTPMAVGSISKMFTAFAVLQLVEQGKVSLDGPVRAQLPEFVLDDPRGAEITVRQLLDHTSGLPVPLVVPPAKNPAERVDQLRGVALVTDPGSTYAYSNLGYQVAARLVEVVSDQDYATYLDQQVFAPLGMKQTRSTLTGARRPGVDDGHVTAYGRPWSLPEMTAMAIGSGSVVSTAHDMGLWLAMQQRGGLAADGTRLLSRELVELSRTPAQGRTYALGWQATSTSAPARVGHDGSLTRYSARAELVPSSGYGVVVLLNSYTPVTKHPFEISAGIIAITEGAVPSAGAPVATIVDAVLALVTVAIAVGGVLGLRRTPGWVSRRSDQPEWRFGLRLLPQLAAPALAGYVFVVLPSLQGNTATPLDAFGLFPSLMILLVVAAVVGVGLTLSRFVARRRNHASSHWSRPTGSARSAFIRTGCASG